MIFWGPPGVGKTTLARIIAHRTRAEFIDFSAVTSGIREIREVMQQAEANRRFGGRTIVFVTRSIASTRRSRTPFCRLSKRAAYCSSVPRPRIRPSKSTARCCRGARCLCCRRSAPTISPRWCGARLPTRAASAGKGWNSAGTAGGYRPFRQRRRPRGAVHAGDGGAQRRARRRYLRVTEETLAQCTSRKSLLYDKKGEEHYNLISALHKSMRNFRSRRGGLLAGADAGIRRGPDVHRPPRDALRQRGRRAGGPARAGDRRGGESGVPSHRHAGMLRAT